jgi:hypothetical protein
MREMAATLRRAAAVILIAAAVLAGGCRPAASGTSLANATPDAPPDFIGKWQMLDPWVNSEEWEVDEIARATAGMTIMNRAIYLDQQGNRIRCEWLAPAVQFKDVLYLKPAPMTCSDGEPVNSVACEVRFISRDVVEAVCPPLPLTRYKRIP